MIEMAEEVRLVKCVIIMKILENSRGESKRVIKSMNVLSTRKTAHSAELKIVCYTINNSYRNIYSFS